MKDVLVMVSLHSTRTLTKTCCEIKRVHAIIGFVGYTLSWRADSVHRDLGSCINVLAVFTTSQIGKHQQCFPLKKKKKLK